MVPSPAATAPRHGCHLPQDSGLQPARPHTAFLGKEAAGAESVFTECERFSWRGEEGGMRVPNTTGTSLASGRFRTKGQEPRIPMPSLRAPKAGIENWPDYGW